MALPMPRSVALQNGVYHLNVRVPADIAARVRGTAVALPIDGKTIVVTASDKVVASLRTKDPGIAKSRFAPALTALGRHWDMVRAGPRPLTHRQMVALAGELYRYHVAQFESDPSLTPDTLEAERARFRKDVDVWQYGEGDGLGEGDEEMSRFLALLERDHGDALLAFRAKSDIDTIYVTITLDDALERLFGRATDRLCLRLGLQIGAESRRLLLREIGEAYRQAEAKMIRNLEGDYSPDPNATRFPAFEPPAPPDAATTDQGTPRVESVLDLFARWKTYHGDKKAASTIRRYGPSVASLDAWFKGRDWRLLTDRDIFAWATDRHKVDGISPSTINRNDLVAISSVLAWPTKLSGGKLIAANAAAGVKLDLPKNLVKREKMFRHHEISAILKLARSVEPSTRYPRASASRRWCPWLCAYSGARIQETLWLQKENIRQEGGIWVMDFPNTKDGFARSVPIHRELIDEGFLAFVDNSPTGFLFVEDKGRNAASTRSAQELRAAEIASWVQSKIQLERGVSPNHAWRHSWITYAEAAGIPKRFSNRITGHNSGDASDGYVNGLSAFLALEMEKFPAYKV